MEAKPILFMLKKGASALALFFVVALSGAVFAETIVSHETEKYFYQGDQMEKFEGQYENTYDLDIEKNTLTRTRIYDYQTKKITPDETVYRIQQDLNSDPRNAPRYSLRPVVRAVGRPDADTTETLTVYDDYVISAISKPSRVVVSRAKRLR